MITGENISIVIQIATLVGIIFAVYLYFRRPQEKGELTDAVFTERFTQFDRELANLRDNHIHSLGLKLDTHIDSQQKNEMQVCEKLARIETKIEVLIQK
jgi:hypothetical protein